MLLSLRVEEAISQYHLLKHPFYEAWTHGNLSKKTLKEYARQYYHHVRAFPRYISGTHFHCDDSAARKILVENLAEEEGLSATSHPELWAQFAKGLGVSEDELKATEANPEIRAVIACFMKFAQSSYEEGLASLFAYESQVPEIAESKIQGLREHFDVKDTAVLEFFEVHQKADVYHRQACAKLMDQFSSEKERSSLSAARESAKSLWQFLTSMWELELEYRQA